jgi:hypothetical protein
MFKRYFTIKDELLSTAAACLFLASGPLIPLFVTRRLIGDWAPHWIWMGMPFLLVATGALVLMRLRAPDTVRSILVISSMAAIMIAAWAGITAATGYTVAQGMIHRVPRLASLNYLYIVIVIVPIFVAAASRYQKLLRQLDGA